MSIQVCPVRAHSDYQYGHVTGFALDKGIHVLYNVNVEEEVVVTSKNFICTEKFNIGKIKVKSHDWADYEICILFSGVQRTLVGSAFNMRVDELKSAAYALMAFSDMPYGKFKDARLRDVPYQVFLNTKINCLQIGKKGLHIIILRWIG